MAFQKKTQFSHLKVQSRFFQNFYHYFTSSKSPNNGFGRQDPSLFFALNLRFNRFTAVFVEVLENF